MVMAGGQHPTARMMSRSPSNGSDWDSNGYYSPLSPADGVATLLAAAAKVEEQALPGGAGNPLLGTPGSSSPLLLAGGASPPPPPPCPTFSASASARSRSSSFS